MVNTIKQVEAKLKQEEDTLHLSSNDTLKNQIISEQDPKAKQLL